jgi:hypothetical protein
MLAPTLSGGDRCRGAPKLDGWQAACRPLNVVGRQRKRVV